MNYYLVKRFGPNTNGKYYPQVLRNSVIDRDALADRIEEMCTVTKSDVQAVLTSLVKVMTYELQNGNKVLLDDFGYFYVNIKSSGVTNADDYDVNQNLKALVCRFLPTATRSATTGAVTRTFTSGISLKLVKPEELVAANSKTND